MAAHRVIILPGCKPHIYARLEHAETEFIADIRPHRQHGDAEDDIHEPVGRQEDKDQKEPIRSKHVHFFLPENAIAQSQAWYGKIFGAKASVRNNNPVADVPGTQLRFNKAAQALVTTKGRVLDHIGFDIKGLEAFTKKLEASGIKLDRPYTPNNNGGGLAFIYDPWGTYIELNEYRP